MNAPRIAWVDVGKCIGIFLVVLGHCLPAGDPVKIMIYSFHVPFFFCLSGYIYNDSAEKGSFFLRVKNRFFRLIVPYAIYTLISLPVYFFNGGITTGELIKRIWFYEGRVIWNDPLWFLITLFFVEIIFTVILTISRHTSATILPVSAAISLIVGFFVYQAQINPDYFGYSKILFLFPFYTAGYYIRKTHLLERLPRKRWLFGIGLIIVALLLTLAAVVNQGNNISIYTLDLNSYWMLVFTGIGISLGVMYCLSYRKQGNGFVQYLGKNTLFIMCSHYFLTFLWNKVGLPDSIPGRWIEFLAITILYILFFAIRYYQKRRHGAMQF